MDMETFLRLATEYTNLGWAVQDQLHKLDQGIDVSEMNPNALKMIEGFLHYAAKHSLEGTDIILQAIAEAKFEEDE